MNEVTELQKKRAVNSIWNAARDYSFQPDFKAYDAEGQAELYLNCIIGALRRHYDYAAIEGVFAAFSQEEDADTYEGLFWLGLENCTFQREVVERPVLAALREDYARRFVQSFGGSVPDDYRLLDCLSYAHYLRVLGQEPHISRYDKALLDELEFSPELSTEEIVQKAHALFQRWFQINTEERRRERRKHRWDFKPKLRVRPRRYRKLFLGFVDHPNLSGKGPQPDEGEHELRTRMTAEELREFMTAKYGKALYPPQQVRELERQLCTGNHSRCHLHITGGEPVPGRIQNGFEALQKQREAAQIERNRRYYQDNLARSRAGIQKLASAIQNSVLLHLQPAPVRANTGRLLGGRVWRATRLNDDKVFLRNEQDNMGDLSVDILLDASTSQQDRQEIVSNQGYMIAEALSRCAIPCRVMSFCSMTGYTILRIFRDYQKPSDNRRIFEYVSNGCNRDGLAIRAAHHLLNQTSYEHKLLIVLSDVKPNDILKMPGNGEETFIEYEKEAGITDTAFEVRRARADGISVICVFTGDDEDLPSARLVYGHDFARIQSLDRLADTVSLLIQNQLRNL